MILLVYIEGPLYIAKWGLEYDDSQVHPLDCDATGLPLAQQAVYAIADVLPLISDVSDALPGDVIVRVRNRGELHRCKEALAAVNTGVCAWSGGARAFADYLHSRGITLRAELRNPNEDGVIRRIARRGPAEELTIGAGGVVSRVVGRMVAA